MNDLLYRNLFSALPELSTERLLLRPYREEDACDVNEYTSHEEVSRYLRWAPHLNLRETKGYIEFMRKRYQKGLHADWAIVLRSTGKVIGVLKRIEEGMASNIYFVEGEKNYVIPAVDEFIVRANPQTGIIVRLIDGLEA